MQNLGKSILLDVVAITFCNHYKRLFQFCQHKIWDHVLLHVAIFGLLSIPAVEAFENSMWRRRFPAIFFFQ